MKPDSEQTCNDCGSDYRPSQYTPLQPAQSVVAHACDGILFHVLGLNYLYAPWIYVVEPILMYLYIHSDANRPVHPSTPRLGIVQTDEQRKAHMDQYMQQVYRERASFEAELKKLRGEAA